MASMDQLTDVVVVGAGMAGLAAAVRAQQAGARVTLLEKGPQAGGTVPLSGGMVWTAPSYEVWRRIMPQGDATLGRVLVENYEASIAWLREVGVRLGPRVENIFGFGVGHKIEPEPAAYPRAMQAAFEGAGGKLLLGAAATELLRDSRGEVVGVRAKGGGHRLNIGCQAVVLATGGFQANYELLTRYLGRWADRFVLRSIPFNTGDGLLMGLEAGAAASRGMHAFYGHLMPAPPARIEPPNFRLLSLYYSPHGILVNLRGERFTDESLGDTVNTQALAREPEAKGFLVIDQEADKYEQESPTTTVLGTLPSERLKAVMEAGGMVATAPTIKELAARMGAGGVPAAALVATIEEYNQAVAEGRADELKVPRRAKVHPLSTPDYYAVAVVPGITFTNGGLRVNSQAQVLDRRGEPIGGLYAAGADAGGIFYERYAGGLALSLVFGRLAGAGAAQAAP